MVLIGKVFTILIVLSLIFIQAQNTPVNQHEVEELINQADSMAEEKKYVNALSYYQQLLKVAKSKNLKTHEGNIHRKIGNIYFIQKEYKTAVQNYRLSLQKDSTRHNKADNYLNMALVYRKLHQKDSLLHFLDRSMALYETQESSLPQIEAYAKAGILYKNEDHWNEAITYLLKAFKGFEEIENPKRQADVAQSIGSIQRKLGNLVIAEQYYLKSLELRRTISYSSELMHSYNNLGNLYKEKEEYSKAINHYQKAISFSEELGHKKERGRFFYNLATVYQFEEKYPQAKSYYQKALVYKQHEKDTLGLINTYNELAFIALQEDKPSIGQGYLLKSKNLLRIFPSKDSELRFLKVTSKYYEKIGNFKKALEVERAYTQLYHEIYNEKQTAHVQALQERFESQQKKELIEALSFQRDEQKGIINQQELVIKRRNLLIVIFSMIIGIVLILYFLFQQKQKNKNQQIELEKLQAISHGQESLKKQIGKDLHDLITTSQDGLALKVLAIPKSPNPEQLSQQIVSEIKQINRQIRDISHRLSPLGSTNSNLPFTELLLSELTEFQYYLKIFIQTQFPLPEILDSFTLQAQTHLYAILLEVINNIDKHAHATEIQVNHEVNFDREIQFIIEDNGVGINFNSMSQKGIGIRNIKERSQLLQGSSSFKSSEKGTKVIIQIPIQPNIK